MTLFDVDKNSDDRGTPTPNAHDRLALDAMMSKGTNSVNYTADQVQSSLLAGKNGQFTIVAAPIIPGQPTTGVRTRYSVAHNLNFIPAIQAYVFSGASYLPMPYITISNSPGSFLVSQVMTVSVDATNINVEFNYNDSVGVVGTTPQLKCFLLQQTAN